MFEIVCSRRLLASGLLVAQLACGAAPQLAKMDLERPIETADGYRQGGERLDPEDMTNRLSEQPAATAHVSRARTLGTIGIILATAGGALIGWPAGEALAGGDDPPWVLAAAGGGAVLLSIPFVLWSGSSLDSAVEAHNAAVGSPVPQPEALRP